MGVDGLITDRLDLASEILGSPPLEAPA